jgi:hypothetical protein
MPWVTLTFDLEDAGSEEYVAVALSLAGGGLSDELKNNRGGTTELPANTFAGSFDTVDRKHLVEQIRSVFRSCGVTGRAFVSCGAGWSAFKF